MKTSIIACLQALALVLTAAALVNGCSSAAPVTPASNTELKGASVEPSKARVNGVVLHYVDRGRGDPVVFVHGGLADYREWEPVANELANEYRTVTYSRRYNFPNDNPISGRDHSAIVEADDLAALNRGLRLGAMHVVGVSYGAYAALELALREPGMVRSLTLVEPPLVRWLPELPGGPALFDEFHGGMWQGAGRAFERGDPAGALRISLDYFVGPGAIDKIPPEFRSALLANIREWQALTTSRDAFPPITREQVRSLKIPVLMLSGGKTYPMLRLTDDELERHLQSGERQIIANGTHDVCSEEPAVCAKSIRAFLGRQRR